MSMALCTEPVCLHVQSVHDGEHGPCLCPDCPCVQFLEMGAAAVTISPTVRLFGTGATRSADADRDNPEAYLSPLVIDRFNVYMTKHRKQADGTMRDADNWQLGMPRGTYLEGAWRHFLHLWTRHRGWIVRDPKAAPDIQEDLCALFFNIQGYLHSLLVEEQRSQNENGRTHFENDHSMHPV